MGAQQLSHKLDEGLYPPSGILLPMRGRPPENPSRVLPNRIREWRLERGLTIGELAERMQSNYQTVARHETGNNDMTLARLERYAEVLDVTVEELLNDGLRVPGQLKSLVLLAQTLSPAELNQLVRVAASLKEPSPADAVVVVPTHRRASRRN